MVTTKQTSSKLTNIKRNTSILLKTSSNHNKGSKRIRNKQEKNSKENSQVQLVLLSG